MNMENNNLLIDPPFGGSAPFNWDFNFSLDPATSGLGSIPMDIEAWSTVAQSF